MQTRKQEINHIISLIDRRKLNDLREIIDLSQKSYLNEISRSLDPFSRVVWDRLAKLEQKEPLKPINYDL